MPVNQKASAALGHIAKSIPVTYVEYFGLKYADRFQKTHWIDPDKSLHKQLKKSQVETPTNLNEKSIYRYQIFFELRYYPRDPTSINNEEFRYQLFLQIRRDLATNKLTIKDEKIVSVLCGLILQSDFGDYDVDRFAPHYIRQTIPSHLLTPSMEEQIKCEHIKLRGMEPADAEYRFLEKTRWLENYGTIIFPVKDMGNKNCYLGLNPQGFALRYYKEAHLKYDIFWPRISSIRRTGRQFMIKEKTDKTIAHRFETGEKFLCKTLYKLALEHFVFFKSKKDEKPLVKEPTKRTFGKHMSKEVGYSSDTSDNNQYSDDTFSSNQDSINTIQSAKLAKVFKKPNVPIRNCASDAEESAFSKKNRKVIVCKSQTETEDDYTTECGDAPRIRFHPKSTSHDRIPADYIYENRLESPQASIHTRQKRLTKKLPNATGNERRFHGHRELAPLFRNQKRLEEPLQEESKFQIPFKSIRTKDSGYKLVMTRSGDSIEMKAKMRRRLPSTDRPRYYSRAGNLDGNSPDRGVYGSSSVENGMNLRPRESPSSPTKRMLPVNPALYQSPPIPKHRLPPKPGLELSIPDRPQSLFDESREQWAIHNVPLQIPQRTGRNDAFNVEVGDRSRLTNKPNPNYVRRSIQESGI